MKWVCPDEELLVEDYLQRFLTALDASCSSLRNVTHSDAETNESEA